jgi:CHAD domain-containing protein
MAGGLPGSMTDRRSAGTPDEMAAARVRLTHAVRAVRKCLANQSPQWDPSEEELHLLHRTLRRLRIELRPWKRALRAGRRRVVREADRELREVARLVGEVRDRDVAQAVLERLARRHEMLAPEGLRTVRTAIHRQARSGRKLVPAAAEALLASGVLKALDELAVTELSEGEVASWRSTVRAAEERVLDDVRRRYDRARKGRTPERLHELRQALRSARLWSEAYTLPTVAWYPESLGTLQARLGRLHDLSITHELLRTLPPRTGARVWVGPIRARFDARCRTIQKSLSEEGTELTIRRLVGDVPDSTGGTPGYGVFAPGQTRRSAWA